MQFTRCTQGILLLGCIFAFFGIIINDAISASVSIIFIIFIVYQYIYFTKVSENILDSIQIKRTTKQSYYLQNADIDVHTDIKCNCAIDMGVYLTDILPAGSIFSKGTISNSAKVGCINSILLKYTFKSAVSGDVSFGGVRVSIRNQFFKDEILVSRKEYTKPALSIYQTQTFKKQRKSFFGDEEIESLSHLVGSTIHSIRDYVYGDDLKHIDWKKSAKFDKLFVREYMRFDNPNICIIIDLPDKMNDLNEAAFMKMKDVMVANIILNMKNNLESFFIIISGGNFVRLVHSNEGIINILQEFKNITPFTRSNHFYRNLDYSDMRIKKNNLDGCSKKNIIKLYEIYSQFIKGKKRTIFEDKMYNIFYLIENTNILLFSLVHGDVSHFKPIVKNIKNKKSCKLNLYVPNEVYQKSTEKKISEYAFDKVVVI